MIDLNRLNIEILMDVCAVANSPMYIYKHFSTDFSVQSLAQQGAHNLINTANEILSGQEIHLEHLAKAYSLLIALNYVDMLAINKAFEELPMPAIRWAAELVNIIKSKKIGNVTKTENVIPKPHLIYSQQLKVTNNELTASAEKAPWLVHPRTLNTANSKLFIER